MGKEMGMWSEDMRLKIDGNLETEMNLIEIVKEILYLNFVPSLLFLKSFLAFSSFASSSTTSITAAWSPSSSAALGDDARAGSGSVENEGSRSSLG